MPIRVLAPEVAAQIAAGEVVERPASVVKELVENALDADATQVSVEIAAGGLESIRVTDNGCGIAAGEIEVAFARHATSKLFSPDDLGRIATLGFRGEALPSIAAVAEVEVVSRPPGADAAVFARLDDGRIAERGRRGAPAGTTVTVSGLFARQPARRKFLRSPGSETNQISAVVSHYALAYPEVRFSLRLDARTGLQTTGSGDRRDAVAAVYGAAVAAPLLPLEFAEGPLAVEGLAGPPHVSRAGRGYVSIFVNRRWVQSRRLVFAVEEAYQGLLQAGRRPIAVVDLRLPPEEVDVNVHPTKAEVRFRDESAAFVAVQRAVRAALLGQSPVAAAAAPALRLEAQPSSPLLWEHAVALERRHERAALDSRPATPQAALPALRVIGQLGAMYIIAEGPDGLYLIDQHAAHERVLYERFAEGRAQRRPEVQGLMEPLPLEVSPGHEAVVREQGEALAEHGFALEPFGPRTYLVRAVPAVLAGNAGTQTETRVARVAGGLPDMRQAVLAFLDEMLEPENRAAGDPSTGSGQDRVALSLACHAAVRAGKTLSTEEMRELVLQLEGAEVPHTCPHGRPTMVHMSAETLAREFGRR
ncbi:MAG: DNA mismatch repair endonuclease MutL [Chloroflexi bacterium]|nr:DNA mismatch repair endonuclease MutL [Chloroflexota bacterium]